MALSGVLRVYSHENNLQDLLQHLNPVAEQRYPEGYAATLRHSGDFDRITLRAPYKENEMKSLGLTAVGFNKEFESVDVEKLKAAYDHFQSVFPREKTCVKLSFHGLRIDYVNENLIEQSKTFSNVWFRDSFPRDLGPTIAQFFGLMYERGGIDVYSPGVEFAFSKCDWSTNVWPGMIKVVDLLHNNLKQSFVLSFAEPSYIMEKNALQYALPGLPSRKEKIIQFALDEFTKEKIPAINAIWESLFDDRLTGNWLMEELKESHLTEKLICV